MLSMTLCYYGECTIYRYIQNPLLLKGRKFDVRSYLLIACTTPYMVFFRHGYVRLTCDLYDPNTNNMSAHLTNQVNTVAIFISHNLNNILYKRSLLYWDRSCIEFKNCDASFRRKSHLLLTLADKSK